MKTLIGLVITALALEAHATQIPAKDLTNLVAAADCIFLGTVTAVDVVDKRGKQVTWKEAPTGPSSKNQIRLHVTVASNTILMASEGMPNKVVVPLSRRMRPSLKGIEGKTFIFLLWGHQFKPAYPLGFMREQSDLKEIKQLLKFRESRLPTNVTLAVATLLGTAQVADIGKGPMQLLNAYERPVIIYRETLKFIKTGEIIEEIRLHFKKAGIGLTLRGGKPVSASRLRAEPESSRNEARLRDRRPGPPWLVELRPTQKSYTNVADVKLWLTMKNNSTNALYLEVVTEEANVPWPQYIQVVRDGTNLPQFWTMDDYGWDLPRVAPGAANTNLVSLHSFLHTPFKGAGLGDYRVIFTRRLAGGLLSRGADVTNSFVVTEVAAKSAINNGVVSTEKISNIVNLMKSSAARKPAASSAEQKIAWGENVAGLRAGVEVVEMDLSTSGLVVLVCHLKNVADDDSPAITEPTHRATWDVIFTNTNRELFYAQNKTDAKKKFKLKTLKLGSGEERACRITLTDKNWTFLRFAGGSRKRFSVLPPGEYSVSAVYTGYYVGPRPRQISTVSIQLSSLRGKKGKDPSGKSSGNTAQ